MPQPNDLSRSPIALNQDGTLIAVIEMSQSSWLVAGIVPGIARHPLKKLAADAAALLGLLERWRGEATQAGRQITRIVVAFEAGRDGFWLARWLRARGIEAYVVDSSGCRNTAYVTGLEELVQSLGRCSPAERLSRPAVEGHRHGCKVLGAVRAEVGALWKVLAQQPVGVLVRAALPGAVRIAEVDLDACVDLQARVLGHLGALIPGQRSSQLFGYGDDRARDGVAHRLSPMPGERGPVLGARSVTVARHAGQVEQD